jgi:hypothetical protein
MTMCSCCSKVEVELEPGPPWDPEPKPGICAGCENEQEQAAEDRHLQEQIEAAARAGRFDLI